MELALQMQQVLQHLLQESVLFYFVIQVQLFHRFMHLSSCKGLETLSLRVERHVENALKVVDFLKKQPLVEKVNHPSVSEDPEQQALYKKYFPNGGGSIFTFEIKGGAKEAQEFIDQLKLFSLLANVADVKSLVIHRHLLHMLS